MARSYGRASLTRRRRSDGRRVYCAHWYDGGGKLRQRDLGFDAEVAQQAFQRILVERDREMSGAPRDLEPEKIRERYVADLRSIRSEGHAERIAGCLDAFFASGLPFSAAGLVTWRQRRLAQGVARSTAIKETGAVRAMFTWALRLGLIREHPIGPLPVLPTRGHAKLKRRALSETEIAAFIAAAREHDRLVAHLFGSRPRVPQTPLWLLFLETGARWSEAARACWDDVALGEPAITFRAETSKTRRERRVPIRPALRDELAALRVHHQRVYGRMPRVLDPVLLTPTGKPWLPHRGNALRRLRALLKAAGIAYRDEFGRQVDIHALRHTFITRLARSGASQTVAQHLAGHTDPRLTAQVYTHLASEDLRSAIATMPATGETGPIRPRGSESDGQSMDGSGDVRSRRSGG